MIYFIRARGRILCRTARGLTGLDWYLSHGMKRWCPPGTRMLSSWEEDMLSSWEEESRCEGREVKEFETVDGPPACWFFLACFSGRMDSSLSESTCVGRALIISSSSSSSTVSKPNYEIVWTFFQPGSSPSPTKSVFLLSEPVTLPPYFLMSSWPFSRLMLGRTPVMIKVRPVRQFGAPATEMGSCEVSGEELSSSKLSPWGAPRGVPSQHPR